VYLLFLGATCIAVRVDMSCFKVQVFDNGHGIQKADLETVAERSDFSTQTECRTVIEIHQTSALKQNVEL
jgi:DNA mismatch repair ATPase MutL